MTMQPAFPSTPAVGRASQPSASSDQQIHVSTLLRLLRMDFAWTAVIFLVVGGMCVLMREMIFTTVGACFGLAGLATLLGAATLGRNTTGRSVLSVICGMLTAVTLGGIIYVGIREPLRFFSQAIPLGLFALAQIEVLSRALRSFSDNGIEDLPELKRYLSRPLVISGVYWTFNGISLLAASSFAPGLVTVVSGIVIATFGYRLERSVWIHGPRFLIVGYSLSVVLFVIAAGWSLLNPFLMGLTFVLIFGTFASGLRIWLLTGERFERIAEKVE